MSATAGYYPPVRGCVAEIRDLTTTHWVRSTERIRLSSFLSLSCFAFAISFASVPSLSWQIVIHQLINRTYH